MSNAILSRFGGFVVAAIWFVQVTCTYEALGSQQSVRAWRSQIDLPTYPWAAVKHPYFRGTDGVNIYPYPMMDFLSRDRTNRTYRTVVLENEYLRITFIPELGGKVHEVIDKTTGHPMFYVNHVVKPALIGQCGAWTSGGIEWNTGPQGHTVSCMQPVDVVILPRAADGSMSVAIGETERIYGTKWTVVVTLRPGRSFIEERIRIYNPTETIRPYYFWNCTAVPNTKGFRFIYPMTLGTDHGAERFFTWPVHEGKDLSRGTSYQDAASIFAWECDQDFFGSYNEDLDRGVVACADHRILPGKKAWTWGWGSYGTMHQADLTDSDGPYNEVQTGPLITQADVGRLDPCEAVSWQEWWYPVHGIGGFDFANTNLAAKVNVEAEKLVLKILGTGHWPQATVRIRAGELLITTQTISIDQARPAEAVVELGPHERFSIDVVADDGTALAGWNWPLDIPVRKPPAAKKSPETATELVVAGWQHYLLARFSDAERCFRNALEKDPQCRDAFVGLAHIELDRDPGRAAENARAAVGIDPTCGHAQYALAIASFRLSLEETLPERSDRYVQAALDAAWNAARDPATAVPARALIAKVLIRNCRMTDAARVLSEPGPWQADPTCRGLLAYCLSCPVDRTRSKVGLSNSLAKQNLEVDPLDLFARLVLALNKAKDSVATLAVPEGTDTNSLLELFARVRDLGGEQILSSLVIKGWTGARSVQAGKKSARTVRTKAGSVIRATELLELSQDQWPWRYTDLPCLRAQANGSPTNGAYALSLGHLLFHLGRHNAAREMWRRADALGYERPVANRALGMAAWKLDNDLDLALEHLTSAHKSDPNDAIIARDLARLLHQIADGSPSEQRKREAVERARDVLMSAFEQGKGRSDFVALLARSLMKLGDYQGTAKLLDSVRITIWEGAREAHDLFEEAHLAIGEEHLQAGRPAEALAEFNRALEYPPNLATGRLESAREAHIHYLRGKALSALGKHAEAIAAWKLAAEEAPSSDPKKEKARENARKELESSPYR